MMEVLPRAILALWLVMGCFRPCHAREQPECKLDTSHPGLVVLSNGYVRVVVNVTHPHVQAVQAAFLGDEDWGANVVAATGWSLEEQTPSGTVHSSSQTRLSTVPRTSSHPDLVSVALSNVTACNGCIVSEDWVISLQQGHRGVSVTTSGSVVSGAPVVAVRHSLYALPWSNTAFFQRGVVQMMNAVQNSAFFGSEDRLFRVFAVGGGMSFDYVPSSQDATKQHVLLSLAAPSSYHSGLQAVVLGNYGAFDTWNDGWSHAQPVTPTVGTKYTTSFTLTPNTEDFPAGALAAVPDNTANIPFNDLHAFLVGIYANPVGCMDGYFADTPGQMAPTIHRPNVGYAPLYNFFDPDDFLALSAVIYSGDEYLLQQAKAVVERTGAFMLPSGQVPHHFIVNKPTYIAISGATQTGPNLFWTLTCLQYATASGDHDWLRSYIPKLRNSTGFLVDLIDPSVGLLYVPGSLMIDVFIRNNYTADSNAMIVRLFREMSEAEQFVGNASGAATYTALADTIVTKMNELLWSDENDHYVTQRNKDNSTRDFVDYDANLIAVANGLAPDDRVPLILKRVDAGRCTHGKATFVSERWYGPGACFGGNVGDSWTAMGRIGYFDALSRKRVGDLATFDKVLLGPLQTDVLNGTWIRERYSCNGLQQMNRTANYFEYPAVVTMMLREVRYGILLGLSTVRIAPFGPSSFTYHIGDVFVQFSDALVTFTLPGYGDGSGSKDTRTVSVTGLTPSRTYNVTVSGVGCSASGHSHAVQSSSTGEIAFSSPIGILCSTQVAKS